jgi:hypothetical protein
MEMDDDEDEPPLKRNVRWAPPKAQPFPVSADGGETDEDNSEQEDNSDVENLALQELILPDTPLDEMVQNTSDILAPDQQLARVDADIASWETQQPARDPQTSSAVVTTGTEADGETGSDPPPPQPVRAKRSATKRATMASKAKAKG